MKDLLQNRVQEKTKINELELMNKIEEEEEDANTKKSLFFNIEKTPLVKDLISKENSKFFLA